MRAMPLLLEQTTNIITRQSQHSQECKTHAGTVFLHTDLDLWPCDTKYEWFPGLIVQHLQVMYACSSSNDF